MFLHWRKQLVCVCVCVCVNFDWTCWFRVIIYIMCQNTAMKLQTKTKEQFLSQWPNKPIDCELTSQNCPLCYHIFWEWQCSDLIRQKHISLLHFHNSNAECRSVWHYSYITITCCVVLAELEQLKTKKSVYLVNFTEKGSHCSLIKYLDTANCFGALLVLVLYLPLGMCAKMTQSTIYAN